MNWMALDLVPSVEPRPRLHVLFFRLGGGTSKHLMSFHFLEPPLLVPPGNTQQIFSRPPPAAEFTIAWPLQQASNAALKEI